MNPMSNASYSAQVLGEPNLPFVTNILELSLNNIKPDKKLHFIVYYASPDKKIVQIKNITDRYEVSYNWSYKGEIFYGAQWRLAENDKITEPPPSQISAIQYNNKPNTKLNPIIPKRTL